MNIHEFATSTWQKIVPHKRYALAILILIFFVVRGFLTTSSVSQQAASASTYVVASWTIENAIKVVGTTKITNQQTITFQAAWGNWSVSKVTKLNVKEGDTVKAGQLLAEIDMKSFNIQLSQQALSIQNARLNYQKLLNQYTESDKIQAQKNVDDTQTKLNLAKNELKILQAEEGNVVDTNTPKIQNIITTTQNIINDAKSILDTIDEIFYITKSTSSRYMNVQIYISAKNNMTIYKDMTSTNFYAAKSSLSLLESALSIAKSTSSIQLTSIKDVQSKSRNTLSSLYTLLDAATTAVNNSIDGTDLSLSTIQWRSSSLTSFKSKVLSYQNSVSNNISDLNTTKDDIIAKENEIHNLEAQLAIYKNSVQDTLNWPDSTTRQLQANSIAQSSLSYQQLAQQKENYQIVAPFDGTVNAIGFKQGDNVDNTQWITISNPNTYEVNVLIDQVDIVKVNKWQLAEISFDSYPGYTVTGTITTIDPTPVTTAWVVSYYAKIAMVKGEKSIYDSMTVTVNIIIDRKKDVLIVPNTAIQSTSSGTSFVQVVKWSSFISMPIAIWITDGVNSEVLSGLQAGDVVSLAWYTVSDTETNSSTSGGTSDAMKSSMGSMRALEWSTSWWPAWWPPN